MVWRVDDDWSWMMLVALAKVEAISGQRPTLAVLKPEVKPPALTVDALNLSCEVEASQPDVVKTSTPIVQSQVSALLLTSVTMSLVCLMLMF